MNAIMNAIMKPVLFLVLSAGLTSCSSAEAASIYVEQTPPDVYSLYLKGEELDDLFDTVIVDIQTEEGARFSNPTIDPTAERFYSAGDDATFISPALDTRGFGGNGFVVLGAMATETNVEFTTGPVVTTINTSLWPYGLFLVNAKLPQGTATANMLLVRAGTIVADLTVGFGVPEPSTMILAGLGLVGFLGNRRRNG